MSGEGLFELGIAILSTTVTALLTLIILSALFSSPAALQPGDQFYSAQQSLKSTASVVVPMIVVGVPTVALWIISQMEF